MAKAFVFGLFLLCAGAAEAVSPVQKVIQLLDEYKTKVMSDLAAEEKAMAEYAEFCDDESSEKGYAIKTATNKITTLNAEIEDGNAKIASYNDDVAAAGTQMAGKEKQLDEASVVRASEKDAFQKNEAELISSVDDLERAVAEIKRPAASFLQKGTAQAPHKLNLKSVISVLRRVIDASWVNAASRRKIDGLLQTGEGAGSEEEDGDDLRLTAPKADAFESSAGGIIETLEEMKEKAEEALTDARNTETQQQHTFAMMAQSLTDGINALKEKINDAKGEIAAATQENGENQDELTETTKNKKADEKYLASLTKDCEDAKEAWATRQEDAKAEMGALSKAKEILSSRVKVLVQVGGSTVSQRDIVVGSDETTPAETRTRQAVVAKLSALGHKFNSFAMMEMVSAASADPFEKIKGLIEEMIAKLIEEANQEATQKAFCDEEIGKSKASKEKKTMDMEKLQSRIDTASSKLEELKDTITELESEVAALDKATAEATKIRNEEKADYDKSSKDFKEAAEAVEQAIEVLKEYYEGASLAQVGEAQPSFGSKKSDAGSTIISILEMAGEDFTKTYMELQTQEQAAAAAYTKLTNESQVSRTTKLAEVKGMESQIKSLEVALKNHKEDIGVTTQELDAVLAYMDKLKPQCESKAMTYGEKKARREAEIEGLKEALTILQG